MTKVTAQTAVKQAKKTYQKAKGKAVNLADAAKQKLEDAKDKSTKVFHNVEDQAVELRDDILSYVKENPIKTLSVAALTAFIAGFVARTKQ